MNQNTETNDQIPFALPSIGKEEEDAVIKVLRSKWLTTGKVTEQFEKDFSDRTGASYSVSVNSATAGLHLVLDSLDMERDSYVITTPYTFTATAEVIRYLNLHPLFVDITEDDYNIDPLLIENSIKTGGKKISSILPVHIAGHLCRMDEIMDISRRYDIPVVEDAAHAFPVCDNGKYAGTYGEAGVFSFYATKTITTGEGGMVVTSSDRIARHMRKMRLHGIDKTSWDRNKSNDNNWYYEVKTPGFKYNLTDMASAIGIQQLKKADAFNLRRAEIAAMYNRDFSDYDFITLPPSSKSHCWHLYIIRLNEKKLKITRDEFIKKLLQRGISTSVHFIPLHLMPYYKNAYNLKPDDFPRSMKKYLSSFSLPIYPGLDDYQVERIISSVIDIGTANYC
ncbi:MAG: DegT/DnrJ/EryC1/StrS family aminotransferase [Spirochaetia bacterium]|jgi:dTDP-4-amino-4,6-dideoxygalactose transaminase|nr:DegT/DnrJ/EryC1/StrS family aminotransferase [Spirochaetia bacterium]